MDRGATLVSAAQERIADGAACYAAAVRSCVPRDAALRVVVVGANDGRINDPVYPVVAGPDPVPSHVLLIEPQVGLIAPLRAAYRHHPAARIVQAAVGAPGDMTLWGIDPALWPELDVPYAAAWPLWRAPTGVASTRRDTVATWLAAHAPPGTDIDAALQPTEVSCRPLPDILAAESWPDRVDVLQIDTEGADDVVLAACAVETTRPQVIWIETAWLTPERRGAVEALLAADYHLRPFAADLLALRREGG